MAQITDYGSLKSWIANTGHRSDLTTDIPGFIQSAEGMIADSVRAIELVTTAQIVEADRSVTAIYNLPDDFLGARAVTGTRANRGYALKQVAIAELYMYGLSGVPLVYSIYDKTIEFRASPAVDAAFTLIYYARPAAFVSDTDTNTLLTGHPDLYQHSAMHWFHIHTQDVELAAAHENAFRTAVESINATAEQIRGAASVNDQYNYCTGSTM